MRGWIFKIIYMPIGVIMAAMCLAVLGMIFKDTGWELPFRWLCIIAIIAYAADRAVNS